MKKIKELLTNQKYYRYVWQILLISIAVATLSLGLITAQVLPGTLNTIFLVISFIFIVITGIFSIFYYVMRVLRTPKREKHIVYYKKNRR